MNCVDVEGTSGFGQLALIAFSYVEAASDFYDAIGPAQKIYDLLNFSTFSMARGDAKQQLPQHQCL